MSLNTNVMYLQFAARSDRGLVRGNNEDSAYAGPHLLALADGMGGHAAGEVASQLMIERVRTLDRDPEDNDMLALLGGAARDANAEIAGHVKTHPETEGMGTTLSALLFNGHEFGLIHAGDSRGYRLRGGKLTQITKDDTFVQSLVDNGKLAAEDVSSHPQKSLILKAYTGRDVEPSLTMLDARPGDRLLLCSDGLSDPVTNTTIESALGEGSLADAATLLVDLALRSGGPDNVTVVVAEVTTQPQPAAQPILVGAIAGELVEPTHPDTAASRAARLHRTPQVIPGVPSTTQQTMTEQSGADAAADSDSEGDIPRRKRRIGWVSVTSILAVLLLVLAGGFGTKQYLANTYYLATDDDGTITIKQGVDYEIFGRALSHDYQRACINADGNLGLQTGDCGKGFTQLTLNDLPATERGAVANLPAGSYDAVQTQLQRLTDRTLPPCPQEAPTSAAAPSSAAPSTTAQPSPTPKPGVDCREVK